MSRAPGAAETGSLRTCVVCRRRASPGMMVRLRFEGAELTVNARSGRGYWVHRDEPSCHDPEAVARALGARGRKVEKGMVCLTPR